MYENDRKQFGEAQNFRKKNLECREMSVEILGWQEKFPNERKCKEKILGNLKISGKKSGMLGNTGENSRTTKKILKERKRKDKIPKSLNAAGKNLESWKMSGEILGCWKKSCVPEKNSENCKLKVKIKY